MGKDEEWKLQNEENLNLMYDYEPSIINEYHDKSLKRLKLRDWNQFRKVDMEFSRGVTIITGVNGSGKSSIIRLLSKLIGWDYTEIKSRFMPSNDRKVKLREFMKGTENVSDQPVTDEKYEESLKGEILVAGETYELYIPGMNTETSEELLYEISIKSKGERTFGEPIDQDYHYDYNQNLGISIPSHRLPYFYNSIDYIQSKNHDKKYFYREYQFELMRRQVTGYDYDSDNPPQQYIKSSLITMAMYSGKNQYILKNNSRLNFFKEFIEILKIMLPETLKFRELKIDNGEVVLETETGNFLLDSVSGGIGSIIDLSWQIFMAQPEPDEQNCFFVLIDEIENHLHPSMQRSILPKLKRVFPEIQFIVTTHSPFVVNSVEDSKVYALRYNEENKVESHELNLNNDYSSAMEILRGILDVPVLMPIWIEEKLEKIVHQYSNNYTGDIYSELKSDLHREGLSSFMSETIDVLKREIKND